MRLVTWNVPSCRGWVGDFAFGTPGLLPRLRGVAVDLRTDASDHQPMLIDLSSP